MGYSNTAFLIAQKIFLQNQHFTLFSNIIIYLTSEAGQVNFLATFEERISLIKTSFTLFLEPFRMIPWMDKFVQKFNFSLQQSIDTFSEYLYAQIQQANKQLDLLELFKQWNKILDNPK